MDNGLYRSYKIDDRSFIAFVKREIHTRIAHTAFTRNRAAQIDIVVSELTSNLIKHAGSGEILYRISQGQDPKQSAFEIFSIDNGPGMHNVGSMLRDGISTTRTLGQGLGAIRRLSDDFHIYSQPGWGTIVYARIIAQPASPLPIRQNPLELNTLLVAKPGEEVCGDGIARKMVGPDEVHIMLGDGLGHGPNAHDAINTAIQAFNACTQNEPVEIIRFIHQAVRKTRGLVATIAVLNFNTKICRLCGVGNIATRLYDGTTFKKFMPYNGIIGLNMLNTMSPQEVRIDHNYLLVMCSDGINTRWDVSKFPGLIRGELPMLASLLYKDFCRRNDDSSILIGKIR